MSKMTRRTFLQSAAVATLLYGVSPTRSLADGGENDGIGATTGSPSILKGNTFHLTIDRTVVNITGKPAIATTVNGTMPGPTLVWREGEEVTIHVTNRLPVSTSIHWHGIILPPEMDGVPDISFDGIAPGETFTYCFKVKQHGTYWYHSHSGFQEQTGLHGALVILPRNPGDEPFEYDRDYVIALSDWSDEKPESIYRKLKIQSDYYNFNQRTVGDFFHEVAEKGFVEAFKARKMWNEMRMSDRDLSDVTAYTYTFLMNGRTDAQDWHALFRPGEKVRLRFINQSAMTIFDVRIPGLKMRVVAADGNPVQPVDVEEFRIAVAESYDVIVEPEEGSYCLFAQSIDRSGFVGGTLSSRNGVRAKRPPMEKPQSLTMADMGMGGWRSTGGMSHETMKMDHGKMKMDMPHKTPWPVTPLPMRKGVAWTMTAMDPRYRLDDPGVGLRHNGRRVLTYADLRNYRSTADDPKPDREIVLHLTGNMERYIWAINGIKYADAQPLRFHYGERLRITFINDTMMPHPMHLHGMWSDLETGDDTRLVRKHTVLVQPGAKISYRVTVDARGSWAYHCHMLYHMLGMFRKVEVV
ncbi:copper resistance system multicopper oxidase [Hydrogenimonas urashimensis]|uniref:copper resistance system multicopper oxidase n=1 Tax=Hydrogenimonas urashimensis TaxID=2740515 RepID=UPI0024B4EEC7|nr:copper resistance system multicopper oxidase [Hydrogenimonas urashimensis]